MDIGEKLKEARLAAHLTQEQAAERLGVSRQTMSNWENSKTYPDIVSVIKMSDLYAVSLDHLLKGKEESPMSNYMTYLEKSTDTVRSRIKLSQIIVVAVYLGIWAFTLLMFWCFTGAADGLGFGLIFLFVVLPVTTFVLSLLIGKNNLWGRKKWLSAIGFGVMYMLMPYATFSLANMIANDFSRMNVPNFGLVLVGAGISAIGLGIGSLIEYLQSKHR